MVESPIPAHEGAEPSASITFSSPMLEEAYNLLMARSPSFREGMEQVARRGGFKHHIAYHHDMGLNAKDYNNPVAMVLESSTVQDSKVIVTGGNVILFTSALENQALWKGYPRKDLILDIASIIAHEIFSHTVPYILSRDNVGWPGPCNDPVKGEVPYDSCSLQRENIVRRELGLPERTLYSASELGFIKFLNTTK